MCAMQCKLRASGAIVPTMLFLGQCGSTMPLTLGVTKCHNLNKNVFTVNKLSVAVYSKLTIKKFE